MGQAGVGANAELTQWPMPQLTYPNRKKSSTSNGLQGRSLSQ